MNIYRGYQHIPSAVPCALAIGKFDGLHRGHLELLGALRREARQSELRVAVLTFTPSPREYFSRKHGGIGAPPLIQLSTFRDKVYSLGRCGVEQLIVQRFDEALATMPAETFIRHVLVDRLNVRLLVVGDDFRFGADRQGDLRMLRLKGEHLGFSVRTVPSVLHEGARISSTAIRTALGQGNRALAEQMLGSGQ